MPNVFGREATELPEIISVLREFGDRVRGVYRARYVWRDAGAVYAPASLERPPALRDNPADVVFPWEQVYVAAATCAGSDYPMFAPSFGVHLESVELVLEGLFDPRREFDGVDGYIAPRDAPHCYLSLHARTTIVSASPRAAIEMLHARVLDQNMVLDALRGVPRTDELFISTEDARR
jgi:hypothetical protein